MIKRTHPLCQVCGGKVVVHYRGKRSRKGHRSPSDTQHDLCQRCWQAEWDRIRLTLGGNDAHVSQEPAR